MIQVSSMITIDASAVTIWQAISDYGVAGENLSGVVNCEVEGEGVGALRTLTSSDGSTIVERLETLSEAVYQLSYILLTDTPFRGCLTTMAVRELDPHQSELTWSATFEADGLPESEAAALMEAALTANCLALKQFMEK